MKYRHTARAPSIENLNKLELGPGMRDLRLDGGVSLQQCRSIKTRSAAQEKVKHPVVRTSVQVVIVAMRWGKH